MKGEDIPSAAELEAAAAADGNSYAAIQYKAIRLHQEESKAQMVSLVLQDV